MILSLFRRDRRANTISALYGMIVAQARLPCFYRDYAVPDTVNGRFDLIVLHLALALGRLLPDPELKAVGQGVFDRFCEDMDSNLREMGISDVKVPKEMRRMGEAYYGRAQAYDTALAAGDGGEGLVEALSRNLYSGSPPDTAVVRRLAAYMQEAVGGLRTQASAALAAGTIAFPDPAAIPQGQAKS